VELPKDDYATAEGRGVFVQQVAERLSGVAGLRASAVSTSLPLRGVNGTYYFVEGQALADPHLRQATDVASVSPQYFAAMQIAILHGRPFNSADRANSLEVAVVDETFARAYWPNQDPIGRRISFRGSDTTNWTTVVGVAAHVKNYGVDEDSRFEVYVPFSQFSSDSFYLVVRAAGEPRNLATVLEREVGSVDKKASVAGFRTMEDLLSEHAAPKRTVAFLLGVFAVVALSLAAIGVYGVIAFNVASRTREIGLRVALGADRGAVLRLVLRDGIWLTAIAVFLGILTALGVAHALTRLLYGVSSADPLTFSVAPLVLIVVAVASTWLPARHASRIDPLDALRCD
jgi:predicted permease